MSQAHITEMLKLLNEGLPKGHPLTTDLSDYKMDHKAILELPDEWVFTSTEYCPLSDIPEGTSNTFRQPSPNVMWALGDNGMCLFGFKLERRST